MAKFEITFLDDYNDESLLSELCRIAQNYPGTSLSTEAFDRLSGRVSASTIRGRFGGWREALQKAGLGHLYGGPSISQKMRAQVARRLSDDELIAEMRRVHSALGHTVLTTTDFDRHSTVTGSAAIRSRFGRWKCALRVAGMEQSDLANKNWTEEECFENLATVWVYLGRTPTYREMFATPSTINGKAYETRWGTWRKAIRAFIDWTHSETDASARREAEQREVRFRLLEPRPLVRRSESDQRQVGARLRFRVFQRDRFKCIACGRSPATHLAVVLHADHIVAVALGGKTVIENLQTLCESCNLGKGKLAAYDV